MVIEFKENDIKNNLKIIREVDKDKHGRKQFECLCLLCNEKFITKGTFINTGKKTSCGCDAMDKLSKSKTKHGGRKNHPKEYQAWQSMKNRCYNKNYHSYHRYGGRGITVCDEWKDSFENFLRDMGKAPNKIYQLDRANNDEGYNPSNCRWITPKENSNNRKKYNNNSGYTGVFFRKSKGRYDVNVAIDRKIVYIGVYYSLEEAVEARKSFIINYNNKNKTKLKYEEFVK